MSKCLPGSTSSSSNSSSRVVVVERERCDYSVRPSLKVAVDVGAGMKMRLARPAQFGKNQLNDFWKTFLKTRICC